MCSLVLKMPFSICMCSLFPKATFQIVLLPQCSWCLVVTVERLPVLRHSACYILYPITKTRLFKYIENFTNKNCKFSGGSNKYPQSMFLSRNKKNYVYPCKPDFYYVKVGFKGVKII